MRDLAVEHDGLRFRCRIDGPDGEAPWVVFSNSILTDLTIWDRQAAALADRFRVLRYDQRGHGRTAVPPAACTFDQLGGDLVALLDRFGVETCICVGLSMGVPTGLHLVAHHPRRVSRLVLVDGQAVTAPNGAAAWETRIAEARRVGMDRVAEGIVSRWLRPATVAAGGGAPLRALAAGTPLEGYEACARALQGYDFSAVLPTIGVPTLMLAGADDGTFPETMRRMCAQVRGARLRLIPDAGHLPNYERPDVFTAELLAFLARDAAGRPGAAASRG